MFPANFDRFTAMAFLKALTGGRDPAHGDTIVFQGGGKDKDLGWIFSRALTAEQVEEEVEISWDDIIGKPSTFPPSAHIHPEVLCGMTHGDDENVDRPVGYLIVVWIGTVFPAKAIDGDYVVLVNFL